MAYDIRPLSFGEILDRAFRVYRDLFKLLFGISALVWIPSSVLLDIVAQLSKRPLGMSVFGVVFLLVFAVQHAALVVGVAEVYLGRSVSIGQAFRPTWRLLPAIMGTYLLLATIVVVSFVFGGGVIGGLNGAERWQL
jgi:hypothetical protein